MTGSLRRTDSDIVQKSLDLAAFCSELSLVVRAASHVEVGFMMLPFPAVANGDTAWQISMSSHKRPIGSRASAQVDMMMDSPLSA